MKFEKDNQKYTNLYNTNNIDAKEIADILDKDPTKQYFSNIINKILNKKKSNKYPNTKSNNKTNKTDICHLNIMKCTSAINNSKNIQNTKINLLNALLENEESYKIIQNYNKFNIIPITKQKKAILMLYFISIGLPGFEQYNTKNYDEIIKNNSKYYQQNIKPIIAKKQGFPINNKKITDNTNLTDEKFILKNNTEKSLKIIKIITKKSLNQENISTERKEITDKDIIKLINFDTNKISNEQKIRLQNYVDIIIQNKKNELLNYTEENDVINNITNNAQNVGTKINQMYINGFVSTEQYKNWMKNFGLTELEIKLIQKRGEQILGDSNIKIDGNIETGNTMNYIAMIILGTRKNIDQKNELFSLNSNELGIITNNNFENLSLEQQNYTINIFFPSYLTIMKSGRYMETKTKYAIKNYRKQCILLSQTKEDNNNQYKNRLEAKKQLINILHDKQRENHKQVELNKINNIKILQENGNNQNSNYIKNINYTYQTENIISKEKYQTNIPLPKLIGTFQDFNNLTNNINNEKNENKRILLLQKNNLIQSAQNKLLKRGETYLNDSNLGETYNDIKIKSRTKHHNKPGYKIGNNIANEREKYELTLFCLKKYTEFTQSLYKEILDDNNITQTEINNFLKTYKTNYEGKLTEFTNLNNIDINKLKKILTPEFTKKIGTFNQNINNLLTIIFPNISTSEEIKTEINKMIDINQKDKIEIKTIQKNNILTPNEQKTYTNFLTNKPINNYNLLESVFTKIQNSESQYKKYKQSQSQEYKEYLIKYEMYQQGIDKIYSSMNLGKDFSENLKIFNQFQQYKQENPIPGEKKYYKIQKTLQEKGLDYYLQTGEILNNYYTIDPRLAGPYPNIQQQIKNQQNQNNKKTEFYTKANNLGIGYLISGGLGLIYGFGDATVGLGGKIGYRILSNFKNEDEMIALNDYLSQRQNGYKGLENPNVYNSLFQNGINGDALFYQVGSAYSNMKILLTGSKSLGIGLENILEISGEAGYTTGLLTIGTIISSPQYYIDGINNGLTKQEATQYALFQGGLNGALELVSPNEFFFSNESKKIGIDMFKEIFQEITQEELQDFSAIIVNNFTNHIYDSYLNTNFTIEDFLTTAIITALTTGIVYGEGNINQKNNTNNYENIDTNILDKYLEKLTGLPQDNQFKSKFNITLQNLIDELNEEPGKEDYIQNLKKLKNTINNNTNNTIDNTNTNNTINNNIETQINGNIEPEYFVDELFNGKKISIILDQNYKVFLNGIISNLLDSKRLNQVDKARLISVIIEYIQNSVKYCSKSQLSNLPSFTIELKNDIFEMSFTNTIDKTFQDNKGNTQSTYKNIADHIDNINKTPIKKLKKQKIGTLLNGAITYSRHEKTGGGVGLIETIINLKKSRKEYKQKDYQISYSYNEKKSEITINAELPISLQKNEILKQKTDAINYLKNLIETNPDKKDYYKMLINTINSKQLDNRKSPPTIQKVIENSELEKNNRINEIKKTTPTGINLSDNDIKVLRYIHTQIGENPIFHLTNKDIHQKFQYFIKNIEGYPKEYIQTPYKNLSTEIKEKVDLYNTFFANLMKNGFLNKNEIIQKHKYTPIIENLLKDKTFDNTKINQWHKNEPKYNNYMCCNETTDYFNDAYKDGEGIFFNDGKTLLYTKYIGQASSILIKKEQEQQQTLVVTNMVYQVIGNIFLENSIENPDITATELYSNVIKEYPAIQNFINEINYIDLGPYNNKSIELHTKNKIDYIKREEQIYRQESEDLFQLRRKEQGNNTEKQDFNKLCQEILTKYNTNKKTNNNIIFEKDMEKLDDIKDQNGQKITNENISKLFGGTELIKEIYGENFSIEIDDGTPGYILFILKNNHDIRSIISFQIKNNILDTAFLLYTKFPIEKQGQGLGKKFKIKQMQTFKKMGIKYIEGNAGKTEGKTTYNGYYSWMTMGITPMNNETNNMHFLLFKHVLENPNQGLHIFTKNNQGLTKQQKKDLQGKTNSSGNYNTFFIRKGSKETININGTIYTSNEIYEKLNNITDLQIAEYFSDPFRQTDIGKEIRFYNGFAYSFKITPDQILETINNNQQIKR